MTKRRLPTRFWACLAAWHRCSPITARRRTIRGSVSMTLPLKPADVRDWLASFRLYIGIIAIGNLIWETAQLPLYTIWEEARLPKLVWAVLHCTAGDAAIAATALGFSLMCFGRSQWPAERFRVVALSAISIGVAYTVYSEWLNAGVRNDWAYADAMPVLPPFGTGLSPLLQWIVIPTIGFWATSPSRRSVAGGRGGARRRLGSTHRRRRSTRRTAPRSAP